MARGREAPRPVAEIDMSEVEPLKNVEYVDIGGLTVVVQLVWTPVW